jgi:nucleoside-triphosphatase
LATQDRCTIKRSIRPVGARRKKGKERRYLETVPFLPPYTDLAIIDEIGRMECLSTKFTRLVVDLLDAPVMVVATTIALHGKGIIDTIKGRADVHLYRVTRENRDSLVGEIEKAVRAGLARRT